MKFIWIIITILTIGCTQKKKENYDHDRARLSNEIKYKVALQLKNEKNLHPCGMGGGGVGKIRVQYLAFDYYQQCTIEEARELLVDAGNLFLKAINEDERIRPYLQNYPFLPKNIEMSIFFKKPNGSEMKSGKLSIIDLGDAKLKYKINDPETNHLIVIHTETYEEAAEKLGLSINF
jgi:hypothetical protein